MRKLSIYVIGALTAAVLVGCSNSDKITGPGTRADLAKTVWDSVGVFWMTTLDATNSDQYTYYSFSQRAAIDLTDDQAASSSDWDIAFKRSFIKTNGGVSGPADVKSVDLVQTGIALSDEFASVTSADATQLSQDQWMGDSYDVALDSLWKYNLLTHQLTAKQFVYVLSDAAGHYVKLQVLGSLDDQQPPMQGKMILKYFYQPTMDETSLVGAAEVDTVDAPNGFYYDFSSGQIVSPANPMSSSDWDIYVKAYDFFLNSSIMGSGQVAAFAAYDGLADKTDFDGLTDVNQFGDIRWVQDELSSAFTASDWFNYNDQTHSLTSKLHTYLVKVGDTTYKIEIVSYYDPDSGASAVYTLHWVEL